jgi:hypothetical protein
VLTVVFRRLFPSGVLKLSLYGREDPVDAGCRHQPWAAYGHSTALETPQHQGVSVRRRAESPIRFTAKLAVNGFEAGFPQPTTRRPDPRSFSLAEASSSAAGFPRRHRRSPLALQIRPSLVQVGGMVSLCEWTTSNVGPSRKLESVLSTKRETLEVGR